MSPKSISLPVIFALLGLLLSSCEKVIDVDLNSADPKTVIEANLAEGQHTFHVRVYQTKDYFSDAPTVYFDNAAVTLSDNTGEFISLTPVGEGWYEAPVNAVAGKTYTLQVINDGATFTAMSILPEVVELKQLSYKKIDLPGEENNQEVYLHFDDKPDVHNYYRILVMSNDSLEQDLQYFDDKYIDGNAVQWSLINLYDKGIHLDVELRSIDAAAYRYYHTMEPILSGNTDTAPGNPDSNWSGGALGYFIAYSSSRLGGVVE